MSAESLCRKDREFQQLKLSTFPDLRRASTALFVLTGAVVCALPSFASGYAMTLAVEVMIAGVFASGINLLIGYTGLVSLGQAMFLGLGGYGIAVGTALLGWPLWISAPITLVVVAMIAAAIGAICTRTRGVEFLLITLAFSQMFYGAAIKLRWTNGSDGMSGIPRPDLSQLGLSAHSPVVFYYYILTVSALALLLLCASPLSLADQLYTIHSGGKYRTYLVHTPPDAGTPLPTVVLLHPYSSNASGFLGYSGFSTLADAQGFVVAAPNTAFGAWGQWNVGGEGPQNIDDIGLLRDMIAALVAQGISDPGRVYAAGMSDGGFLVYRAGCELSDQLAAIAVVASTETQLDYSVTPPQPVYPCAISHPVPVLHIHGLADTCVRFDGGTGSGLFQVPRQSVPDTIANWQARNACAAAVTTTQGPDGLRCSENACASGAAVRLCTIPDAGHIWPGAAYFPDNINAQCGGSGSDAIDAISAIWSFVAPYRLVNGVLGSSP